MIALPPWLQVADRRRCGMSNKFRLRAERAEAAIQRGRCLVLPLREHLRAIGGAALTSQRRAAYLSNARTITADTVSPRFAARSCAAFHTSSGTRTERSLVSATAAQLAVTCAICGKRGEVCDGEQRPLVGVGDVGGRGRMGLDACGQPVSGVILANDCAVEVHPEVTDLRSSSHVYTVSQFGPFVYTGAP